jgi:hypothetical protein
MQAKSSMGRTNELRRKNSIDKRACRALLSVLGQPVAIRFFRQSRFALDSPWTIGYILAAPQGDV